MNDIVQKEPAQAPEAMTTVIERMATNPDVDVHKLEKMLEMQERIMDREAEQAFNIAMANLRKELPAVLKNKKNTQTNSKYADLDNIKKAVDPLLAQHGFYDRYEDDYPEAGMVGTTCEIVHEQGHSKKNRVQFVLDDKGIKGTTNKTTVHASASSMTYGQRLALCRALGIRISEDDDGNGAGEKITDDQAAEIKQILKDTGSDTKKFLQWAGEKDVDSIPAVKYSRVMARLSEKKKEAKNG